MATQQIDVSAQTIHEWAEGTLMEWLPGYNDEAASGIQYKTTPVASGTYKVEATRPHAHLQPRYFTVTVSVEEVQ